MAYESLDDVVEQIADWCGVYGVCEEMGCGNPDSRCCRTLFVTQLKDRILEAVRVDTALENVGIQND